MSSVLLQRFLTAFPKAFVVKLLERQSSLYQQSIDAAFTDQPWSDSEAITLLPYLRRALWENAIRHAAIECGLKTNNLLHVGKNSSCVHVKAAGIVLTEHYVDGQNEFVREAESRKQNAGVNRWLNHYVDNRLLTAPAPKLEDRPIYINLLHGAVFPSRREDGLRVDESTTFLRFAVPAADSNQYLAGCVWSAQELLAMYATADTAVEPVLKPLADEAIPLIKKKA